MAWVIQKVIIHSLVGWSQDLNYLGLTSFESTFIANCCESAIRHHGQVPAVESAFDKQVIKA